MDDSAELITEWPVTDFCHQDADNRELNISTSRKDQQWSPQRTETVNPPSSALRSGKRQYQELPAWNVPTSKDGTGKDSIYHKKENDQAQCSLPTVPQREREKPHADSGSGRAKYVSEIPVKAPRTVCSKAGCRIAVAHKTKELAGNSQIVCGRTADCAHLNTVAELDISEKRILTEPSKAEDCSRNESAEVAGYRGSTSRSLSGDNFRSAEVLAQSRMARWWRRQGQCLVGYEQRGNALGLPSSNNPNTLLFRIARSVTSVGTVFCFLRV